MDVLISTITRIEKLNDHEFVKLLQELGPIFGTKLFSKMIFTYFAYYPSTEKDRIVNQCYDILKRQIPQNATTYIGNNDFNDLDTRFLARIGSYLPSTKNDDDDEYDEATSFSFVSRKSYIGMNRIRISKKKWLKNQTMPEFYENMIDKLELEKSKLEGQNASITESLDKLEAQVNEYFDCWDTAQQEMEEMKDKYTKLKEEMYENEWDETEANKQRNVDLEKHQNEINKLNGYIDHNKKKYQQKIDEIRGDRDNLQRKVKVLTTNEKELKMEIVKLKKHIDTFPKAFPWQSVDGQIVWKWLKRICENPASLEVTIGGTNNFALKQITKLTPAPIYGLYKHLHPNCDPRLNVTVFNAKMQKEKKNGLKVMQ